MPKEPQSTAVVTECLTKLDEEGEKVVVLKIETNQTNSARDLALMVGRDVKIGQSLLPKEVVGASVTQVALKPDKEKALGVCGAGKLAGGGELERFVGQIVLLKLAQLDLPGTK